MTNIAPVFKKSKKKDPDNYRPISLTTVPDKVTEIILGLTEKDLKDNAVIGHSQPNQVHEEKVLFNKLNLFL